MQENGQINYKRVMLTPQMAKELLSNNTRNRNMREKYVEGLAASIRRGEWEFDGSPVRVSESGVLLDGQHRLMAIAEAGIACDTILMTGLRDDVQLTIDSGKSRTFADWLRIIGVKDAPATSSVTRLYWMYERGHLGGKGNWRRPDPQPRQLMESYVQYQGMITKSISRGYHVKGHGLKINATAVSVGHMVLTPIDTADAAEFFERLRDGAGLKDRDPIFALRRQLNSRPKHVHLRSDHQLALIIKAWNAWRDGKGVDMVVYRTGGSQVESFPEPH